MNNYYDKYIKYKKKYLDLRHNKIIQKGGGKPYIKKYNKINRFSMIEYPEMEELLNPIYGCFLSESGFIKNNYFLHKSNFINNDLSHKIFDLTRNIDTYVTPNMHILKNITPIDIGRYIAILYFIKMNGSKYFIGYNKQKFECWFYTSDNQILEWEDYTKIKSYIDKINKVKESKIKENIKLGTINKIDFHLLLYCLWHVLDDDKGIDDYYQGIEDIFTIINKYSSNIYNICTNYEEAELEDTSFIFEEVMIRTTMTSEFNIFSQGYSFPFCDNQNNYPDCSETTMRNLINLICFEKHKFNIDILREYPNVNSRLIEYYETFTNFVDQAATSKKDIYGLKLNARDAWSYLIIHFANENLTFNTICSSNEMIKYNLKASSKTLDGTTSNVIQLLYNLLGINSWNELITSNGFIKSVKVVLNKANIGEIRIIHKILGEKILYYNSKHTYFDTSKKNIYFDLRIFSKSQQEQINILNNIEEISQANYLYFNYNTNIIELINNDKLLIELIKISLTDIIDKGIRNNISIETYNYEVMILLENFTNKEKLNEYIYICDDFNFIPIHIPQLTHINCKVNIIDTVNLDPLVNITSIGNNFLGHSYSLKEIHLGPLSNVIYIGNYFLSYCFQLESINLSPLSNIISIGNGFLSSCRNLNSIDLSPLVNIKYIGNRFLYGCSKLKFINLLSLCNINKIKSFFLYNCSALINIDLTPLSNVTSIGSYFLGNCRRIKRIDLTSLINLTSIDKNLFEDCTDLEEIIITQKQEEIIKKSLSLNKHNKIIIY